MGVMRYTQDQINWYELHHAQTERSNGPCVITNAGVVRFSQLDSRTYNRKAGPSLISPNGEIKFQNVRGDYHRTNGPAIISADGSRVYIINDFTISAEEFFVKYGVL